MTEENVRKAVRTPWVSFGSDGGAYTADPVPANATHPRPTATSPGYWAATREQRLIPLRRRCGG
jgi:hypothetical protein